MRRPWLATLVMLGLLALPASAAQADAMWTGSSSNPGWSVAGNWTGTPPASDSAAAGTLTFPELGTCSTCYTTNNDLTAVSASGLVLRNTQNNYVITGNGVSVGAGGITNTAGGGPGDSIKAPLVLTGGPQDWAVGSSTNGYNSLTLLGGVSETSPTPVSVTVSTPHASDLFVDSDMEVGPVTSNGSGTLHIGGSPTSGSPGSVNGANGNAVTINGGTLIPNPNSTSGSLTMSSGTTLWLGTNPKNNGATTLAVNGSASLNSSSTTKMFINGNGTTAGTDFSQLSASGNITVGGQLVLGQGGQGQSNGPCQTLQPGDVATLVTASGTLTGTFSNAPNGAILTMASSCQSTLPQVQIQYTANSVTATVVGAPTMTTTTLATPNPSPATTNQPVTLTATVSASSGSPSGTVAFSANGSQISGCQSQSLTAAGASSAKASCSTSFAAAGSPESLAAVFTPSVGSGEASSSSAPRTLTVNKGTTATGLAVSTTTPAVGGNVTYTAIVTPASMGATTPTGTVTFQDGGGSIPGCSAQTLQPGSSSAAATCTISYPGAGTHTITVTYAGDGNFTGSSASATTVTVQPATTTTALATPSPSPVSTNQAVTLTAAVSTSWGSPSGNVSFSAGDKAIAGCTSQPVLTRGSSGTATCATSFAAAGSPESLTATFTGASGSGQVGSTSSPETLAVGKGSTSTKLGASKTSPAAGEKVTYTATLTPVPTGAIQPSGTVTFRDGSSSIRGCAAQPLGAGSTATCTVHYSAPGRHTITAAYGGDGSFTGSSSPKLTVTAIASAPRGGRSTGRLVGPGGRLTVRGRTIRFTQKCQSQALCRGSFSFTATVRRAHNKLTTVRCASGSFRIRAGRSTTLRVSLSNACVRLLRAQRHHQLTVLYASKSSTRQVGRRKRITLVLT